jgi:hypothetical protein
MELNFAVGLCNSQKKNKEPKVLNIIPVLFKGFNPSVNSSIQNVLYNTNGTNHDGTLLTNGSQSTLTNLLRVARDFLDPSAGDLKTGMIVEINCYIAYLYANALVVVIYS